MPPAADNERRRPSPLTGRQVRNLVGAACLPALFLVTLYSWLFDFNSSDLAGDAAALVAAMASLLLLIGTGLVPLLMWRAYRAEGAASEEQRRRVAMLDRLEEVVFSIDATDRITYVNAAWTRLSGFAAAETVGRTTLSFVDDADRERAATEVRACIAAREPHRAFEFRCLVKEGAARWVRVLFRYNWQGGRLVDAVASVMRDIPTIGGG